MNPPTTLLRLAREGWDYRHWYENARSEIAHCCMLQRWDPNRFTDILAITSPRVAVRRNVRLTIGYMMTGMLPEDVIRSTHAALDHYNETGEIRGPKTSAFAAALKGDLDAVVLDTWMARALGVPHSAFGKRRIRESAARRIRFTAHLAGLMPAQMQAAVWAGAVKRAGRNVPGIHVSEELYSPLIPVTKEIV